MYLVLNRITIGTKSNPSQTAINNLLPGDVPSIHGDGEIFHPAICVLTSVNGYVFELCSIFLFVC